jgi:hypothetical protein
MTTKRRQEQMRMSILGAKAGPEARGADQQRNPFVLNI